MTTPPPLSSRSLPPASVLIVEDDVHTANYLKLNLERGGYRIVGVAQDGAQALHLEESTFPDALIMDILLPGEIDGIETAQRIRARRDVPVLYLTASNDPQLFARAKITDPSAYLLKPFNQRELLLAVELAIERHRLRQQREQVLTARISSLLETMTDGFIALDRQWRYIFVNRRAGEILNRQPELLIGKIIWEEFPESVGQPFFHSYQQAMQENVALQTESYYAPWDRWFENRIFPNEDGICVYFQEITDRKRSALALAAANQRLQGLSARLLHVQEEERRTLARELHDELGQSLTALKISLQSLGLGVHDDVLQTRLATAVSIADAALGQARQMSLNLRPPQLDDLGLAAAIRWNLERQACLAGLDARFSAENVPEGLPEAVVIAAYRISQEALTNILRHARARTVRMRLASVPGENSPELCLLIQDDGAGFDPEQLAPGQSSMGILSMQERAALAGGRLEIDTSPGQGCTVRAFFPLEKTPQTPAA